MLLDKCMTHACIIIFRLTFPSVLVLYQDIIVSIHGVNVLIGFTSRQLFCTSDDLVETYNSKAGPYCTISGTISMKLHVNVTVYPIQFYRHRVKLYGLIFDCVDYNTNHVHFSSCLYPGVI